ncbi:MAG: universal stress protein [Oxalobacter sp.]|nr:MAG: universal stress protein [Oxalobacter sp.]
MTALHHILAATDLSDASLHAVDRGFQIASALNAKFTIMHALGVQAIAPLRELLGNRSDDIIQTIRQDADAQLHAIASDVSRNHGVSAHIELENGLPIYALPVYVDKAEVELVLIGAHGRDAVQPLALGSTAARLLRQSQCPILIVKQAPNNPYQRIFIAIDFSPASEKAIRLAHDIAPQAQLILSHVTEVPFEGKMRYAGVDEEIIAKYRVSALEKASHQLDELALRCGLRKSDYVERILDGHAPAKILSFLETTGCDLVVVGKHGTHVTEELLIGSVTSHIASAASCDVLVVFDKQIRDTMTFAA